MATNREPVDLVDVFQAFMRLRIAVDVGEKDQAELIDFADAIADDIAFMALARLTAEQFADVAEKCGRPYPLAWLRAERRHGIGRTLTAHEALEEYGLTEAQIDEAVRAGRIHPIPMRLQ